MEFFALPPEVNSGRMYAGPGSGPLIAAATAWRGLASELQMTAAAYSSAVTSLTSQEWLGPSAASMAASAAPYVEWMTSTAGQAEQAALQAQAAASAYEAAFAMTVHPAVVAANRSQLASLVATNIVGQNTPAIATIEAQYAEMWAQDVAAMESYATSSAAATNLTPFTSPPRTTNAAGVAQQAAAAPTAAAAAAPKITQIPIPVGLFGQTSSLDLLDLVQSGNLAQAIPNSAASMANVGRQFNRDAISDAKDAVKDGAKPAVAGPGSLGADFRAAATGVESGAGRGGAVMASAGRAPSVGAISVPQTWAVPPEVRQLAKALPLTNAGAAPIAAEDGGENPYTGMALASLLGSGMGGLAARGGSPASVPARVPTPPKPVAKKAVSPAASYALPLANTGAMPTESVAAQLASALAAMPGATIVVIPPSPATE